MGKIRPKDLENGMANLSANRYYGTNGNGEVGFHLVPGASESTGEANFKYAENISAGKLVFFGDGTFKDRFKVGDDLFDTNNYVATQSRGDDAARMRYRIQFEVPENYEYLSNVTLPILRQGTGHTSSYQIYLRIVTLDGTLVKQSQTVDGTQLETGTQVVFNFDNVKLVPGQSYWLEAITTTTDGTNYFRLQMTSDGTTYSGTVLARNGFYRWDGSVWVKDYKDRAMLLNMTYSIKTEQGAVYECNSEMMDTCIPDGITSETKVAGETGKVMIVGVSTAITNGVPGLQYKLNSEVSVAHRYTTATVRAFGNQASTTKLAQIFTCDFKESISKIMLFLQCTDRTISNKFVCKIVEVDDISGLPTDTLVDPNATASIDYKDFNLANSYQMMIVRFPAEFSLTINKKYAIILEIDGTLNTTGYMNVYVDSTKGNGGLYNLNGTTWSKLSDTYELTYSFGHGDDIDSFMKKFRFENSAGLNIGNLNRRSAARFMVSVPTRVKAVTFGYNKSGTPVKDLDVRIETNRQTTSKEMYDNGMKRSGSGGSESFGLFFGASSSMKAAMGFTPTENLDFGYLSIYLWKNGSPSEKVKVRIESDNEGRPSGQLIDDAAEAVEDQSLQTATGTSNVYWCTFKFSKRINVTKNTQYWIVVSKENDEQSSSTYYGWYSLVGGTTVGGHAKFTADGETWQDYAGGQGKTSFYFDTSYYVGPDMPSGVLVSDGAKGKLLANEAQSGITLGTVAFDQEVSLIPNTVYWLVFENHRGVVDSNFYIIYLSANTADGLMASGREMRMPYLLLTTADGVSYYALDTTYRRYPRFVFDCKRDDNKGEIEVTAGKYAGKSVTTISSTAGVLSTGSAGNVYKGTLTSNANHWTSKYIFKAPRDGQIIFLKDVGWIVKTYKYGNNYTPSSTQSGSTAASVNIEKGNLYMLMTSSTSPQDFIISLS